MWKQNKLLPRGRTSNPVTHWVVNKMRNEMSSQSDNALAVNLSRKYLPSGDWSETFSVVAHTVLRHSHDYFLSSSLEWRDEATQRKNKNLLLSTLRDSKIIYFCRFSFIHAEHTIPPSLLWLAPHQDNFLIDFSGEWIDIRRLKASTLCFSQLLVDFNEFDISRISRVVTWSVLAASDIFSL